LPQGQCAALGVQIPIAAEQVAVALGALINGLAFERVIDPDSVPDELFGLIVSRVVTGILDTASSMNVPSSAPRARSIST